VEVRVLSTAPAAKVPPEDQQVTGTTGHLDSPKYKRAVQMSFRMAKLHRSNSGRWWSRKGIPKDVRDEYARLYGASWEAKFSAPSTTKASDAKARFSEWLFAFFAAYQELINQYRQRFLKTSIPKSRSLQVKAQRAMMTYAYWYIFTSAWMHCHPHSGISTSRRVFSSLLI
jgi:hypothetical protein